MEEEIDEETWLKILQLRDIIDPNISVVEALDIAFKRTEDLIEYATKRYGLPPQEARKRFWEEVEELEEEIKDWKMMRQMLRTRQNKH